MTARRSHLDSTGRVLYKDQVVQHIVNVWIFVSVTSVALKVIYDFSLCVINSLRALVRGAVAVVTGTADSS